MSKKTLVDMDEEDLVKLLNCLCGDATAKAIAIVVRKMIEHSLQEHGIGCDD